MPLRTAVEVVLLTWYPPLFVSIQIDPRFLLNPVEMSWEKSKIEEVFFANLCYPVRTHARVAQSLPSKARRAFHAPTRTHVRTRNKVEFYSRLIHRRQNYELSL